MKQHRAIEISVGFTLTINSRFIYIFVPQTAATILTLWGLRLFGVREAQPGFHCFQLAWSVEDDIAAHSLRKKPLLAFRERIRYTVIRSQTHRPLLPDDPTHPALRTERESENR